MMRAVLVLAAIAALAAAPAQAREAEAIEARVEALAPGEFVWQPEAAAEGPVEIVISLADQRALVFRGGTVIGATTISSGDAEHQSPVGRFQVLEKRRVHRSNRYSSAPMPFMQRLNWYGVALHGGHLPGYPASHGCIRLPMAFARHLFGATEVGSFVFVTEEPIESAQAALELARASADLPLSPDRSPRGAAGTSVAAR
ncbi:MAG TPA: L,D-transpeptidase family protein [Allosphingosinicella sp.]|nr:L,D-transpeptidase family protein [Allosphingosinicella sp.]